MVKLTFPSFFDFWRRNFLAQILHQYSIVQSVIIGPFCEVFYPQRIFNLYYSIEKTVFTRLNSTIVSYLWLVHLIFIIGSDIIFNGFIVKNLHLIVTIGSDFIIFNSLFIKSLQRVRDIYRFISLRFIS